jgi:hypothetical protein
MLQCIAGAGSGCIIMKRWIGKDGVEAFGRKGRRAGVARRKQEVAAYRRYAAVHFVDEDVLPRQIEEVGLAFD